MPNDSSQSSISIDKYSELELQNRLAHAKAFKNRCYTKQMELKLDESLRNDFKYAESFVIVLERQAFHESKRREAVAQLAAAEQSLTKSRSNKANPGAPEQGVEAPSIEIGSAKRNIEFHEGQLVLALAEIEVFLSDRRSLNRCLTAANMPLDDELRPPAAVQNAVTPEKRLTAKQRAALTLRQRSAEFRAFVAEWWSHRLIEKDSHTFDDLLQLAAQLDGHNFPLTVLPKSAGNLITKYNIVVLRSLKIVSFVDLFKACRSGGDDRLNMKLPNLRWLRLYLSNISSDQKK